MFKDRVARYLLYGVTGVAAAEMLFSCVQYAYDLWKEYRVRANTPEVVEVLWVNELTHSCASWHIRESDDQQLYDKFGREIKRPKMCKNPFCTLYNMKRVIEIIDASLYSIDLAMYVFSSQGITDAIERARYRGVSIRIITNEELTGPSGSEDIDFSRPDKLYPTGETRTPLMHHKFCVIDGPKRARAAHANYEAHAARGLVMTGSLNWTRKGFHSNWENIVITSNRVIIQKYEAEFERLWQAITNKTLLHSQH